MSPRKKTQNEWAKSRAKELLVDDLSEGRIPLESCEGFKPADVYLMHEEFKSMEYRLFVSRLRGLRKKIKADKAIANSDAALLARDRLVYPKKTHNSKGEPRWEGSAASKRLTEVVAARNHEGIRPSALQASQEDFKPFKKVTFRNHIYQEGRTQRYHAWRRYAKSKSNKADEAEPKDDEDNNEPTDA